MPRRRISGCPSCPAPKDVSHDEEDDEEEEDDEDADRQPDDAEGPDGISLG